MRREMVLGRWRHFHKHREFHREGDGMLAASTRFLLTSVLILLAVPVRADMPQPVILPGPAALKFQEELRLQKLVAKLDQHLEAFWKQNEIQPTERASDAEFLRRVSLDLIGQIPSVSEVREFLASKEPNKRARKIEELLNRSAYATHFASTFRREWVPQTFENQQLFFVGSQFEGWMRSRLRENATVDRMVREMLTAPTLFSRGQVQIDFNSDSSPSAFLQANEFKPENVAASASRLFVGVKLECAQCHNHKFAPIKQEQFWEQAAFFAEVQPTIANISDVKLKREIKIPETTKVVQARFFDGKEVSWKSDGSPRETFTDWLFEPNNPFFARNMSNRMWAHFFGYGLIDPLDEPGEDNQSLIPALQDELAQAFIDSKFDLKLLLRAITRTKAYQLSSRKTHESQSEPRMFARMPLKGFTAEQIFDSLCVATGFNDAEGSRNRRFGNFGVRGDFMNKFATTERRTEQQASILQALTLMNGRFINDQTSLERSRTFAAVIDAPFLSMEGKIETLFLATLTRKPTREELEKYQSYVERGGVNSDKNKALADVFWALLNSSEFILNH
jgi:hypothetical protein